MRPRSLARSLSLSLSLSFLTRISSLALLSSRLLTDKGEVCKKLLLPLTVIALESARLETATGRARGGKKPGKETEQLGETLRIEKMHIACMYLLDL